MVNISARVKREPVQSRVVIPFGHQINKSNVIVGPAQRGTTSDAYHCRIPRHRMHTFKASFNGQIFNSFIQRY
jgi:hypothetical protein